MDLSSALADIMPEGALIGASFKFMEVAEDEIAASPPAAYGAFKWCLPHDVLLQHLDPRLGHHHCRQQISRFLDTPQKPFSAFRKRLALATDAELVGIFAMVTPHLKLQHTANVAYMVLFNRVFPEEESPFADVLAPGEPTAYTEEVIHGLRFEHRNHGRLLLEETINTEVLQHVDDQFALALG